MAWKKFEQRRVQPLLDATITITKHGLLILSAHVCEMFPGDTTDYIEFYYDEPEERIALHPVSERTANSYKITRIAGKQTRKIFAGAFLRTIDRLPSAAVRHQVAWDPKRNFLVVDLRRTSPRRSKVT